MAMAQPIAARYRPARFGRSWVRSAKLARHDVKTVQIGFVAPNSSALGSFCQNEWTTTKIVRIITYNY